MIESVEPMTIPRAIKIIMNAKISTARKDCPLPFSAVMKLKSSKIPRQSSKVPHIQPETASSRDDRSVLADGSFAKSKENFELKWSGT